MVKVACCWDDAVETDIKLVEILHKYNIRATFNVNSGLHYREGRRVFTWQFPDHPGFVNRLLSVADMKSLYVGFRIGAHGVFHLSYTPEKRDEFLRDMVEDRENLEQIFQCEVPGMAYPCGKYDKVIAGELRASGFAYGRVCEPLGAAATCGENPLVLHPSTHFLAADFYAKFAEVKSSGGAFYFWGHSCEMQDVPEKWAEFERRMAFLAADPEVKFVDVIDLVRG